MWLGPSKAEPYIDARVYQNWRWNYNTGGGQLLDWIGHHGDIAHWGLGFDSTGPSEIEGYGEFPPSNAAWNTATKYHIECKYRKEVTKYPVDVAMTISGGSPAIGMGTKWIGTDGWVWVDRAGFDASNPAWLKGDTLPEDLRKVKLYESSEHRRNFLDSVKCRKPTITPVDTAHHSTLPGHLGLISMLVGRKIHWDVGQETPQANCSHGHIALRGNSPDEGKSFPTSVGAYRFRPVVGLLEAIRGIGTGKNEI
jgi:hypothetical protein